MSESDSATDRTITVAEVSEGPGGDDTAPGATVSLPIVEVLTGRAFVTGKSGSGKSNSASVVAEELLEEGFGLLIVDVEGEYYGLKEEFELLHAGADEECDIQVSPEHAEKLATLALERNVPIVLDVSGYLDEETADELVFETARHLFAKEKKLKKPFLLLVEEVHEYIPENGSLGDAGRMLVKIGKRGRKHGLGLMGISQRPANVKKDYITQCDWLVWHRLTWDNDTKVVRRVLDGEHADAVEDLEDGEAFLMTDWSESVRRVQFDRKRTFDAGATPGLDEFERPELKSIDGDLVEELREISEERERRESTVADLRQELERKQARIEELEEELSRARDLERMADQFSRALLRRAPTDADADDANGDAVEGEEPSDDGAAVADEAPDGDRADDRPTAWLSGGDDGTDAGDAEDDPDTDPGLGTRERLVEDVAGRVADLDEMGTAMLRHVRAEGPSDPVEAHVAAGGNADRELAYSRLRALRRAGLVEHADRGTYAYAVPDLVREEYDDRLDDETLAELVADVEERFLISDDPEPGWSVRETDEDEDDADDERAAELLSETEGGSPAFREDDAEYVDEGADEEVENDRDESESDSETGDPNPVTFTADGDGMASSDARNVTPDEGRDAAWVDGADEAANGQTEHDAARDAEFVD